MPNRLSLLPSIPPKAHTRLFALGRIVATPAALTCLENSPFLLDILLARHQTGDWGEVHEDDAQANNEAVQHEGRIISSYEVGTELQIIWIITEADRSVTTLLLPDDY